jgi:hypothetical protein
MSKNQRRLNNPGRSATARKRGKTAPLVFNFGGKTVEIVFGDDPIPSAPAPARQEPPSDAKSASPAPDELPFMNNPG